MKWKEALEGINEILTDVALHSSGKVEIHMSPREASYVCVAVWAGKKIEFLVERASIVEED